MLSLPLASLVHHHVKKPNSSKITYVWYCAMFTQRMNSSSSDSSGTGCHCLVPLQVLLFDSTVVPEFTQGRLDLADRAPKFACRRRVENPELEPGLPSRAGLSCACGPCRISCRLLEIMRAGSCVREDLARACCQHGHFLAGACCAG